MVYNLNHGVIKERIGRLSLFFIAFAFALTMALTLVSQAKAADTTITVTGNTVDESLGENGSPGWWFNRDASTSSPYEFNKDEASIGSGSLFVEPIGANASDKFIAENFIFTPVSDIGSISYDFKIAGNGTDADANDFYMNVYANFGESDPLKFYDCRYDIVPTVGSTAGFTTVTFDPTQATSVTTRTGAEASPHTCPASLADMDTLSPGSTVRVFAINVGDTSASDEGLAGYLDNVVLGTAADTTVYDFEAAEAQSKDDCKNGGYAAFGFRNQGLCIQFVNTGKDSR